MQQFTKKAIIETFLKLLNQRPLDQITVTDLAKECGISRKTFYYYFEDIYQLPEALFISETQKTLRDETDFNSWEDGYLRLMEFAFENKRAIEHLYNSVGREYMERYFFCVANRAISDYVAKQAKSAEHGQSDIDMVTSFFTNAVVGMSLEWIGGGMSEDPEQTIHKLVALMKGTVQCALANCHKQESRQTEQ